MLTSVFFHQKTPKTEKSTGISYVAIFLKKSVNWFDGKIIVGTMIGVVLLWSGGGHLIIIEVYPRLHHNTSLLDFEKSSGNINFTEKITTFIIFLWMF